MDKVVATLPISAINDPKLGAIIAAFVMDVVATKLGYKKVLCINLCGLKTVNENIVDLSAGYLLALYDIDIIQDIIWRDRDGQNQLIAKYFINILFRKGYLVEEKRDMLKCPCGAVESLADADNKSDKKRIYTEADRKDRCKLCNGRIVKQVAKVWLFKFPDTFNLDICVTPAFNKREIDGLVREFSGRKYLVSRSRLTATPININGKIVSFDVDFIWQLSLCILYETGYRPMILVGSNRNLLASLISLFLYQILIKEKIELLVPPYVKIPGDFNYSKLQAKTVRLLLAASMNWKNKEVKLASELTQLIEKMCYRIHADRKDYYDLDGVLNDFNNIKIKEILSKIRKNRDITSIPEFYGTIKEEA